MTSIKQRVIKLENDLFTAEKMLSAAEIGGYSDYPQAALDDALFDLLYGQFHDLITGTCIKDAEQSCIRMLDHGREILSRVKAQAMFKMISDYPAAAVDANPVFVFNPHPYPLFVTIESEIRLTQENPSGDRLAAEVAQGDLIIPSQIAKERSYINYESMKRVVFDAALRPLGITRFDVNFKGESRPESCGLNKDYVFENENYTMVIGSKSGLPESFKVNGTELLKGTAFIPFVCDDNEDPWGMAKWQIEDFNRNPVDCKPDLLPSGVFEGLQTFAVIEDGKIFTEIESLYRYGESRIRIGVKLYKNHPYIDVGYTVFWNETGKMLKIKVPVLSEGAATGQIAYGMEDIPCDGSENVRQRYMALTFAHQKSVVLLNDCAYGCSVLGNVMRVTLLRASAYCAHPIGDRPLIPQDRLAYRIENGVREFGFRLVYAGQNELERLAAEFCQRPYVRNFFPHGHGAAVGQEVEISNKNVVMTVFKRGERTEGYIIRLFNGSKEDASARLRVGVSEIDLRFTKFEVKTLIYREGGLMEVAEMLI